jgi:hypothetical protein
VGDLLGAGAGAARSSGMDGVLVGEKESEKKSKGKKRVGCVVM